MDVKLETTETLYRIGDRIHKEDCRFVKPSTFEWSYWTSEGCYDFDSLQECFALYPWLTACKVCKPTGWVLA